MGANTFPEGNGGMARALPREKISGFVLAGGRSKRLGQDKSMLPWLRAEGEKWIRITLLEHAITRLEDVCDTVSICTDRDDLTCSNVRIRDALTDSGPLGGIVAALEQSQTEWNMFLAVDLPLLPVEVLEALAGRVRHGRLDTDTAHSSSQEKIACVLPKAAGLPQPLCGLYHRALARGMRRELLGGNRRVIAALHEAACDSATMAEFQPGEHAWRIQEWDVVDLASRMKIPSLLQPEEWLLNVNAPEDWRRAQELMSP